MISHIWRRSRIKRPELSAAVKSSSLKPYRNLGGSPVMVPRLNEKGLVPPLNKKNWNAFPSHRMPNTGTWSPCRVLFQQQATTLTYSQNQCNLLRKGCLTITFCNHLSNRIQPLLRTTDFELDFDEKNRNRTKRLEVVLDLAFGSYTSFEDRFWQISKGKTELSNQAIEDLNNGLSFFTVGELARPSHRGEEPGCRLFRCMLNRGAIL